MSKLEKLINRLESRPKDFTYDELASLLTALGYREDHGGRTSGSAVKFVHQETKHVFRLHKPHPEKTLKMYIIDNVRIELEKEGYLK